jgi:16S rRNA processing protein RimM
MQPEFDHVIIGRVTRPHGIAGEVRAQSHTDRPERFSTLDKVWVGDPPGVAVTVDRVRLHQQSIILKLRGVDTRSEAETLRNQWLSLPMDQAAPLEEGEMYLFQMIGLEVLTVDGNLLGVVDEILETGANDVILVRTPSGELLLPDIPGVVLDVDLQTGCVTVQAPTGLIDG